MWDSRKIGQDQRNVINTGVHLGTTGSCGVQEESDGRRGHLSGEEENQGKLRRVRGENGVIITLTPHVEVKWYITATKQGGRCRVRRSGDLHGVIPRILRLVGCLVEGCPERENNPGRLREHFMY